MRRARKAAVCLFLASLLVSCQIEQPSELEGRTKRTARDRSDFTMLNEDGFPLNVDPEVVPAGEAPIGDNDMVMGVVIRGEARAYPVNYMNGPHNEIVNDTLGGVPIAPSW